MERVLARANCARDLESIHVESARRLLDAGTTFITVDVREAEVARSLGLTVLGA